MLAAMLIGLSALPIGVATTATPMRNRWTVAMVENCCFAIFVRDSKLKVAEHPQDTSEVSGRRCPHAFSLQAAQQ